jgi:CheY-like chemotaxis protein
VPTETKPVHSRIIIAAVDDDDDDIDLLRVMFRKASISNPFHVYRRAEDLMAMLSGVVSHPIEVLLPLICFLDVKMPGITGHDLLQWIRAEPVLNAVPVVMLSSSADPSDISRARELGAQCYLAKFPQPEVLTMTLDAAICHAKGGTGCFEFAGNLLFSPAATNPGVHITEIAS